MLKNEIQNCKSCPLYKLTPCGPVMGVGKGNMIVSEGLTYNQAAIGIPFGDEDADVIKLILSKAKVNYKKFYYTALQKCKDVNHEYEKYEYLETCKKLWVGKEIEYNQPEYVLCMGKGVFESLYGEKIKLKDVFGKPHVKDNVKYVPLYSLEYLRHRGLKVQNEMVRAIHELFKS